METVGDRIKKARKALKLSQQELAEECGWEYQSRISGYERVGKSGGREPSHDDLLVLARVLKKPLAYFVAGLDSNGDMQGAGNAIGIGFQEHKMPLISAVTAGKWCESPDNFSPGDAEEWLPRPENAGPRSFALRVDGDSMTSPYPGQRSYPHGSIIYVDPDRAVTNGCRVVARTPDGTYTFKTYSADAGRHYLKPINPQYPMIEITDNVHICGVVFALYQQE